MISNLLYVALGGGLGAVARYSFGGFVDRLGGSLFPYGTMTVNVLGSFAMGLLVVWLSTKGQINETVRLLFGVGLLGGFTTFSSFSLDAMNLLKQGHFSTFILYVGGSVIVSLLAIAAGLYLGRQIWGL